MQRVKVNPCFCSVSPSLQVPGSAEFRKICKIRAGEILFSYGYRLSIPAHLQLIDLRYCIGKTRDDANHLVNWRQSHPETKISLKIFLSQYFQIHMRSMEYSHTYNPYALGMIWLLPAGHSHNVEGNFSFAAIPPSSWSAIIFSWRVSSNSSRDKDFCT